MVDVINKRCEHEGCKSQPAFNVKGAKRGRFCKDHKEIGMVNVRNKRCEHEGCKSQPAFNVEGATKGRLCKDHKEIGMVDVKHKRCEHEGCKSRPSFNVEGSTKGRFCKDHKEIGMVNVRNKRCEHEGCTVRPMYGLPGLPVSHCSTHKESNQIKHSKSTCVECHEQALYGLNSPQYCEMHKTEACRNLVERECSKCQLVNVLNGQGICVYCDGYAKNAHLAKQKKVEQFLSLQDEVCDLVSVDKRIDHGACSNERPDFVYDFGDRVVIVEVDEHQHRDRACLCEQTRMVNISQNYVPMPTIFIRYNPDKYKPLYAGEKQERETLRLEELHRSIQHFKSLDHSLLTGICFVNHLFFDGDTVQARGKLERLL